MVWEEELFALFDDLEQQAEALYAAERAPELADRGRSEYQQVTLAARLMASVGREVTLEVIGLGLVSGTLDRVASGWCLVSCPAQDWVIRTDAIGVFHGSIERAVPEMAWPAVARLSVASALRRLADVAEPCTVYLLDGRAYEGVVRRVGADFVEILTGDPGRPVLVTLGLVAAVQSRR